jgi:hypothetical protein
MFHQTAKPIRKSVPKPAKVSTKSGSLKSKAPQVGETVKSINKAMTETGSATDQAYSVVAALVCGC